MTHDLNNKHRVIYTKTIYTYSENNIKIYTNKFNDIYILAVMEKCKT